MNLYKIPFLVFMLIAFLACTKERFITGKDALLAFSADTLHFDTVFTSVGSTTRLVKIFNENNQKLKLDRVRLAGGANSFFKTNIDGSAGTEANNIELAANDSIYVFVTVQINPTSVNTPFVIEDSIEVSFNGNTKWIQLQAWGQNANFLRSYEVNLDEVWDNEKPYVIIGGLTIKPSAKLLIRKGTKVYLHADSPILVDGSLQVDGDSSTNDRVVFRGDRLDDPYNSFPAAWPGIYFRPSSKDNSLKYADVRNAYQGIVTEGPSGNTQPKLKLEQVVIDNSFDAGILAVGSSISAANTLVSNCGKGIQIVLGGTYNFEHCTTVAVSNSYILHKEPVLFVANFIRQGTNVLQNSLSANFTNCIFWGTNGTVDNEVITVREGNGQYDVKFENCLWKVKDVPAHITSSAMINEDPQFLEIESQKGGYNFRLKESSPAIDKGKSTSLSVDLDGRLRTVRTPDLGAYEMD